jgi:hypothetical protein
LVRRGHRHTVVGALAAALVLAGCGSGSTSSAACKALPDIAPFTHAADAQRALGRVIDADRAALDGLGADDPLAADFRGALTRAERALASVAVDPLRSGTMSPTATIVPAAHRSVEEMRSLYARLCR